MYALKKITVTPDGRQVEESFILGDMYRLEMHKDHLQLAASIEYQKGDSTPCITIDRSDEAYITTLTGDTVRHVCRGDHKARQNMAKGKAVDLTQ